jgi:AraC-like DNA-binding protein
MRKTYLVYREELPSCAALDAVWTLGVRNDLACSFPYLTLPDGCVDLIYRLQKDRAGKVDFAKLLIAGPTDRPATFFPVAREELIGVRFAPGWGGLALRVSPTELFGTFTSASEVTSRLALLEESLFACKSQRQAASVLRDTVERWTHEITTKLETLNTIQMLRIHGGQMRVDQAARLRGISPRSLRRDVKELAGLSPKALSRIFRFRRTLDRINECDGLSLCELALQAGYTDQAHMTREFQKLGGCTPKSPAKLAVTPQSQEMS